MHNEFAAQNVPYHVAGFLILDIMNDCPDCKALEVFDLDNPREYWLMTEVFVYLHGGDECQYHKNN